MVRRVTAVAAAVVIVLVVLSIPLPYVALSPAPVLNTLGAGPSGHLLIQVSGHPTYRSAGRLDLTMVAMRGGPGPTMTVLNYVRAWLSSDTDIYDENLFLAEDARYRRDRELSLREMKETEHRATVLALKRLSLSPSRVHVTMDITHVGGTSAGLMLTLGLLDKLMPEDLTGGVRIAGTGALDDAGRVLGIGGIRQKMIAARRAHDTVFLTPAANCAEATDRQPSGLRLVRVASVGDALAALADLRAGRQLPTC